MATFVVVTFDLPGVAGLWSETFPFLSQHLPFIPTFILKVMEPNALPLRLLSKIFTFFSLCKKLVFLNKVQHTHLNWKIQEEPRNQYLECGGQIFALNWFLNVKKKKKHLGSLPNLNITWLEWVSWEELECFWVIIKWKQPFLLIYLWSDQIMWKLYLS